MRNPLPNLPRELDLEKAIVNKENNSVDNRRKKIPSAQLRVGERIEIQNVKSLRWDMRGTVMRVRDGGASYFVLIDGDDKVVLRNKKFLRSTNESDLTQAQASPECHRLAGGKSPHTSSGSPTKRVTRSKGKRLRFDLRNNQVFEYYYGRGTIK